MDNLDWSQDPVGPDKRSEKQKKKDWVENMIEYENPALKKTVKVSFPPLTDAEKERLKNCDIYGNPKR